MEFLWHPEEPLAWQQGKLEKLLVFQVDTHTEVALVWL